MSDAGTFIGILAELADGSIEIEEHFPFMDRAPIWKAGSHDPVGYEMRPYRQSRRRMVSDPGEVMRIRARQAELREEAKLWSANEWAEIDRREAAEPTRRRA